MRILGTEPSLVILSQTTQFKKVSSQAKAGRDGVINPQNYNFNQFKHGQFWCSQTLRINRGTWKFSSWQTYMSMPTRKPPWWHFVYRNVTCRQSFDVGKHHTFMKFQIWTEDARLLCFSVWGIILLFMIITTVRQAILLLSKNVKIFHKGFYSMGPLICEIWRHGLSTNSGDSYGHKLCSTHSGFVFILLWEEFHVLPSQIEAARPYRHVERHISISWWYIHHRLPSIWETYSWYISSGALVEQSKFFRQRNFFPWFKYKSHWQWCSF